MLLNSYLFLTLLLDASQARTFFLQSGDKPELTYSSIFCASIAFKVGILLLEAQRKSKWVNWDEKEHSPEETSGIFSLGVFFWLNDIFLDGWKKVLTIKDLYPLDSSLSAESLHAKFLENMDYSKLKGDRVGLVKVLCRTLTIPLLLPIPPRLALLGFTFAQPFFIEKLLNYLTESEADPNIGYGLIGASLLIYLGIGISTALCWYFHHRMRAMARSVLVTEIFQKATKVRLGFDNDSAALTLMSTDIERINNGLRSIHEIWASIIQVALASWMLYDQLGVVFVAPMGVVTLCSIGLAILMNFTGDSQREWMEGVQKRVGLTATVIASMKNLKISGLSDAVGDFVQKLRVEELAAGTRFRRIYIVAAIFAFVPLLISPPLTFAFSQRTLGVSRIFTSLSWLLLLTNPLSQVFQSIPEVLSGLACLGRIQAFLESEDRHDFRHVLADTKRKLEAVPVDVAASSGSETEPAHPVIITNGNFGWEANKFALRDINTQISKASLTIVVGPVGSGKSTLCKALLGEIPYNEGTVTLSNEFRHVGFCDQTAFLSNGSIRDNIVGFSAFNEDRYADVIHATSLDFDFNTLPQGDRTNIGSDGITLSGGQKQRVSLARALYLQTNLLVLDDVFSGLDADTEEQVFRQVFGPDGLLRRRHCTVILCTHSIKHIPAADYIIALGDGTIAEQGSYAQLIARQGYVQRLGLSGSLDSSSSSEKSIAEKSIRETDPQLLHTTKTNTSALEPETDTLRQVGDKSVYKHYFKSMGLLLAAFSILFAAVFGFFTNFPTICELIVSLGRNPNCDMPFTFMTDKCCPLQGSNTGLMTLIQSIQLTLTLITLGYMLCSKYVP
ncbi:hypothetical protein EIK77_009553 [Talaromyces pinophilus]|nr:hypothetical protein EIK77_009553 [Talaromyces pinophilus]